MEIGAVVPHNEIGTDPGAIKAYAQGVEELGATHLLIYDHVMGADRNRPGGFTGNYDKDTAFHEPFAFYSFVAAVTERIDMVTAVMILPQRQTVLVAKQAAELAILSGNRFRLGVGTGWNKVEYQALNEEFSNRGRRQDEQVELLRRLWSDPVIEFSGKFHRIDRAGLLPQPARRIPIWFGGFTPVALRRAAKSGDGFLFGTSPSRMLGLLGQLREQLARHGRADADFGVEAVVDYSDPHDTWGREIEQWRAAGGTHVSLRAMDTGSQLVGAKHVGYHGPRDYIEALEVFRREIR